MSTARQHKIVLDESELPTRWYNVLHDLLHAPAAVPLHPGTGQPVTPDDLTPLPLDGADRAGDVGRAVRGHPGGGPRRLQAVAALALYRAYNLERASGPPRGIYYKYEGVSRRLTQAEHLRTPGLLQQGGGHHEAHHRDRGRAGARRWPLRAQYGLECEVWQVRTRMTASRTGR